MSGEWVQWHRQYEEGGQLSRRLEMVQEQLRAALDRCAPGPISLLSLCAGDGRDVIGVLRSHPRREDVRALLLELDPDLIECARGEAAKAGLPQVQITQADAALTDSSAAAVPANIVLACGIFGNISDGDVRNTVESLPMLCAPGATVVWTRGTFEPDLTPTIRRWFGDAGFEELAFIPIAGTTALVGAARLVVPPPLFRTGVRFFRFLAPGERPSRRQGVPR